MAEVIVGPNRYGKQKVHLLRVVRDTATHEVYALTCAILLEGKAFDKNYSAGDHSSLIPTETQKNTLYVLAKKYPVEPIERWGVLVAKDVMRRHPHVEAVNLNIERHPWDRVMVDGKPHNHVFIEGKSGTRFTTMRVEAKGAVQISSGFKDFKVHISFPTSLTYCRS
jgi:urate oxidase